MAFNSEDLSVLSYANGFTLWHYKTTDNTDVIDTVGYFNESAKMLRVGDFVMVNANVDAVRQSGIMVIVGNSSGLVDVSNVVSFGIINSD